MRRILLALVPLLAATAAPAQAHQGTALAAPTVAPIERPELGLTYRDLEFTAVGTCAGAYRIKNTTACTHGPDPAPAGVDARTRVATNITAFSSPTKVPCVGNGTAGKRVQVLYVRASDVADRFADVKDDIGGYALAADRIYRNSAVKTDGLRHIRWVHDEYCSLDIDNVVVNPADDDSLSAMSAALAAQGYNSATRKYLVFADATVYCGIGNIRGDDDALASANSNDGGPSYARVDAGCWGGSVAAHELMHNIGGVQLSAPNSSGGWHCTDEYDRMCYSDEPLNPPMNFVCTPNTPNESLFDCNGDDYFHTAPAAGSYLDQFWNAANSSYLNRDPQNLWGFVYADDPAAASYTPIDANNHNSTGAKNTIERTGTGVYEVIFTNLASFEGESGNPQATAYGSAGEHCTTSRWVPDGTPDQHVTVRCFTAAGAPTDVKFTASYVRSVSSGTPFTYLWADDETSAAYTPNPHHQFNSTGGTNTVTRSSTGVYDVVLDNLGSEGGTVKVTAFAATSHYCKAADWDASGADELVEVRCFDFTGGPVDAKFTLVFADEASIAATGGANGYVRATDQTNPSYTPTTAYQHNSTGVLNTVTRTGTGRYTRRAARPRLVIREHEPRHRPRHGREQPEQALRGRELDERIRGPGPADPALRRRRLPHPGGHRERRSLRPPIHPLTDANERRPTLDAAHAASRRPQKRGDHRARRPREDDARRCHALAVRRLPREPGRQ